MYNDEESRRKEGERGDDSALILRASECLPSSMLVLADWRLLSPRPTTTLGVVEEERRLMIPSIGLGVRWVTSGVLQDQ